MGKIIPVEALEAWDVFRACGHEYVYLGYGECCNTEHMTVIQIGNLCSEVEYLGTREFRPYIPPDWRTLIVLRGNYDALIETLNMAKIEWRPYPMNMFVGRAIQVKDDRYQEAQRLRDMVSNECGPFAPGTK